jgi:molybdopterin/thiamine biosynthesis adenylyltransferase
MMKCEVRFELVEAARSVSDLLHEKYSRQILFAGIGEEGQVRLLGASAVVVGCGAIGAATVNLLVRAGVGRIRIIDRDFVEPSNLQRQTLFDEADARDALPKAVAAERKLRAINSSLAVEGIVADVNPGNAEELLAGFDVILDGTDNFETRFLVNDFAVRAGQPWIYAAAVASYGLTMTIRPGLTPCLACLLPTAPSACIANSLIWMAMRSLTSRCAGVIPFRFMSVGELWTSLH